MKSIIKWPSCKRCGNQYNPKRIENRGESFKFKEGSFFLCNKCLAEYGKIRKEGTEEETQAIIDRLTDGLADMSEQPVLVDEEPAESEDCKSAE